MTKSYVLDFLGNDQLVRDNHVYNACNVMLSARSRMCFAASQCFPFTREEKRFQQEPACNTALQHECTLSLIRTVYSTHETFSC